MIERALKRKKCRICERTFTPISSMSKACSVHCALEWSRRIAAKKAEQEARTERKKTREAKERLKTRGDHLRELQQAFNAWIRLRDANKPCISCGRYHKGQWHAGHYLGVGRVPALRFEPDNVHKQCKPCNTDLSGNPIRYRARLVEMLGLERVEWLEGPHEPLKLTVTDIQEMKAFYRAEVRRLKKEM
ncbi:recombination protein NinG [Burkholderia cenocepacia]|uniref:recombination protein NinG n=1 Tax=Burkholderia cenocepacia TaxID=95486 RepID=UPI002B23F821|nr:recombination protein NinG [Burkholderia cenocepacia]MEB2554067.1 recombination protein NinG [Burkholderia cenocepacia]